MGFQNLVNNTAKNITAFVNNVIGNGQANPNAEQANPVSSLLNLVLPKPLNNLNNANQNELVAKLVGKAVESGVKQAMAEAEEREKAAPEIAAAQKAKEEEAKRKQFEDERNKYKEDLEVVKRELQQRKLMADSKETEKQLREVENIIANIV